MPNVILKCQIGLFHSLKNAGCLAFLLWFLELQCSSTTSSLCYPCFELPLSLMRRFQVSHTYPKLGQVSVKVKIITSKPYLSIVCLNNLILILASLNRAVVYTYDRPILERISRIKALAICNILHIPPNRARTPQCLPSWRSHDKPRT